MLLSGKNMIEVLSIFFFTVFLTLYLFIPFLKKEKFSSFKITLDDYDLRSLNITCMINLILFFSLLNFTVGQIINIFYSFIFIFVIYLLINFKKLDFPKDIIYYLSIFSIILLILSVDLSSKLYLYWDAQKLWLPKASVFFNDGLISDLKNTPYSHYSFLGSLIWSFFWKISSFNYEYFGRIFFIAIYCYSLFNIVSLLNLNKNLKTVTLLFLILITYDYWHFRGTQEILIFSFLLILSKYLFNLVLYEKNTNFYLLIIFLCLNLIIWTKNEGIILAFIIYFILYFFSKQNLKIRFILLFILLFMVIIRFSIFKINGLDIDLSQDFDFQNLIKIFLNNISFNNIFIITKYILFSFAKFPHILISLFCAFVLFFNKQLFKKFKFLYLYLFLTIMLIYAIYLSSPQDIEFMVSTGSLRLMFEFSAPYLLFVIIFFKERFKL